MVSQPAHVTANSKTLIDHIYSSAEESFSWVAVKKLTISDHYAISGKHKLTSFGHKGSHHTIKHRAFKHLLKFFQK